jgi:hypothetical protein
MSLEEVIELALWRYGPQECVAPELAVDVAEAIREKFLVSKYED